ncbi:ATP--dephospho-CoA triphosphoribosyl transferase CitG [Candidatus Bathyarchaeota archaeon]|nr:MAG: ATP--dephospho-CoA triphosphoribosyl transferase CitG [Candidatus Bathyarchaeota archaeon]
MKINHNTIVDDIMRCAQLAAAIEVCGWPKPGNVHRTVDFPDTRFEHFIAGAIALGPTMREAALKGMTVGLGKLEIDKVGVGKLVKAAVSDVNGWHKGGNTHLGVSLLFTPLAVAAGLTYSTNGRIEAEVLRENVKKVMAATTSKDAENVYDAILAAKSAALGRLERNDVPDLMDREAKRKLEERQLTLYDVMVASSKWDNISREWASGMEICFQTGYPTIIKTYHETGNPNTAVVHTFLTIVSKHPDTFIARKVGIKETPNIEQAVKIGLKRTKWIAETAWRILKKGGLTTDEGTMALQAFDKRLQARGGMFNPGTSADLTAGALMISLLCGWRF